MLIPLSHGGFASSPDTIQCAISGSSSAHIDGSRDEIPARGIILVLQRDFGGWINTHREVQFSSVAQSCPTHCNPMNRSTPGLPVHHQLLEFTQTRLHWVSDAIQPSHPLSSPSPPAPNPSQHQYLQIIVITILLYNLYNRNVWKMLAFDGTGKCKHFSEGSLWEGLCWLKGTFLI